MSTTRDGDGYCLAGRLDGPNHPPYLCSLPPGHDGDHETRDAKGEMVWRWEQSTPDTTIYAEQWSAAADVLRAHAEKFDERARTAPSAPRVRRSGALMECGCWWFAFPGSSVGFTHQRCPLHGDTAIMRANVEEPSLTWIPRAEGT